MILYRCLVWGVMIYEIYMLFKKEKICREY